MHRTSVLFDYEKKTRPNKPKVNRNTEQTRIDNYLILSDLKVV